MPEEYEEVFICQSLDLSSTELDKQPCDWVETSMEYLSQKIKYDEAQKKVSEARAKRRKR